MFESVLLVLGCRRCSIHISWMSKRVDILFSHVVVQSVSSVQLFAIPQTAARQASLSFTISSVCSNPCPLSQWGHPAISFSVVPFSSSPQSFPASVFSNELALCIRWPKYWSFSFNIYPSNEYSGLISFRIDWFDLLAKELSRLFSNTTIQKHQFFGTKHSLWSTSHIHTWLLEKS